MNNLKKKNEKWKFKEISSTGFIASYLLKFLDQIYPKMIFQVWNRKNEHHDRIQPTHISPETNDFLIFGPNSPKKGLSKTGKVSFTIEFGIFELGWILNFSRNKQF